MIIRRLALPLSTRITRYVAVRDYPEHLSLTHKEGLVLRPASGPKALRCSRTPSIPRILPRLKSAWKVHLQEYVTF